MPLGAATVGGGAGRIGGFRYGELRGDGWRRADAADFVIAATPSQIDHVGVVSVLENAREVSLSLRLSLSRPSSARAVERTRLAAGGGIAADERCDCAANEIERLLACEAQSGRPTSASAEARRPGSLRRGALVETAGAAGATGAALRWSGGSMAGGR